MSLQLAAQHMASRGRGPDTMLVHMAPSEVNALQTVAKAHGGSLTINPDTGLPEAGFLSSILPMIAGVGLTAISGGTLSPVMAGLLTGGGTALATGNLQKGLMAGLGAYGGAGLGAGFANAGAQEAILQANPGLTAAEIARASVEPGFVQPSMTDKMLSGFKGLGSEAGRDAFMQSIGGAKGLFKSGYTAALPVMMAGSGETASAPAGSGKNPYEYDFTPGYTGPIRTPGGGTRFFDPRFVLRRADGGETYADGGNTGMTGESDEYYRYLMGLAPAPRPYAAPAATQADLSSLSPATPQATRRELGLGIGQDGSTPPVGNWSELTPLQQAVFYAENPGYAKATQLMQAGFALTPMGKLQAAMVPGFVSQQQAIANPGPGGYLSNLDFALLGMSPPAGKQSSNQSLTGGLLNFSGTQSPAPVDTAVPTISNAQAAQMMADEINASLNASLNAPAAPTGVTQADLDDAETGATMLSSPSAIPTTTSPVDLSGITGTNIGLIDANIGIDPSGMGGIDPGVAADVAAATAAGVDAGIDPGEFARGGLSSLAAFARGGYNLGDYSDGGRLLRGPGDGVSDSIPASIGNKRPARLADGEFVIPARIVSELGNGSTEAGARKLYAMMNRVQKNRRKSIGRNKVAVNSRSDKYLPA